jgi:hypothetical protein
MPSLAGFDSLGQRPRGKRFYEFNGLSGALQDA